MTAASVDRTARSGNGFALRRELRTRAETGIFVATLAAPALTPVEALARQPELRAPVKLALSRAGAPELRAELLRANGTDVDALARSALLRASEWFAHEAEAAPDEGVLDSEAVASGLAELPRAWAWEPREDGVFHVHATAFGTSARVVLESPGGVARAFVRSAVPAGSPACRAALLHFALETNARLRLARIGVAVDDDAARLTWDAVASPGVPPERALPASVEAVAAAHAATRHSLRALCHPEVARTYLDARASRAHALPA